MYRVARAVRESCRRSDHDYEAVCLRGRSTCHVMQAIAEAGLGASDQILGPSGFLVTRTMNGRSSPPSCTGSIPHQPPNELIAELRARLEDMRSALATATANAETWRAAFEREQAHRAGGGRRHTVFNLDHRVPRDVVAYGAPGGMDAARGADDLKEISRENQARRQAIHPIPS